MAKPTTHAPMELHIRGGTMIEAMTLVSVLRENISLEVVRGGTRESFLFVKGAFVGTASALVRLRALLAERTQIEVTLVSHDALEGLSGRPVTAMELVLDPDGVLGT